MIRESKITIRPNGAKACKLYCEIRDEDGAWMKQGIIPVSGTVAEAAERWAANQARFGWTLYDTEKANVLVFWKEF